MTLKNNNFSIFLGFFPYNSKNKGEREKWTSDSDCTSKNTSIKRKKTSLFYMTLNDNNTQRFYESLFLLTQTSTVHFSKVPFSR